jgi:hypothetical protein
MTLCQLVERGGKWHCDNCNKPPLKGNYNRACDSNLAAVRKAPQTPAEWFAARYTAIAAQSDVPPLSDALTRLALCPAADCGHLVSGTCDDYYGCSGKFREAWFSRLLWGDCKFAESAE